MSDTFSNIGIGADKGMELMEGLGVGYEDLSDPVTYVRMKDVAKYFKNVDDVSYEIARLKKPNVNDMLAHVWTYTKLRERMKGEVEQLEKNKDLFSENVLEEMRGGYLTTDTLNNIKKDLSKVQKQNKTKDSIQKSMKIKEVDKSIKNIEKLKKEIHVYA